jgi:hypothetical protein
MNAEIDRWAYLHPYERKYLRPEIEMYDEIVRMTGDALIISTYYGVSFEDTQRAKDYAFGHGVSDYQFCPDINMAKAWFRMVRGQGTEIDLVLLQHEILESDLVMNCGMASRSAHDVAQARYCWSTLLVRSDG